MNVKLLLKIKRAISAHPARFNMDRWVDINDSVAPCGTAACIAGWTVMLDKIKGKLTRKVWAGTGKKLFNSVNTGAFNTEQPTHVQSRAMKALQIDREQARTLFYVDYWPFDLQERYVMLRSKLANNYEDGDSLATLKAIRTKMAKVAADRIEHFIKNENRETAIS